MLTFTDNFENDKELILRDHLALERTKLANERTLFAYIQEPLILTRYKTENISVWHFTF
jgi:putative membrane protein